MKPEIHCLSHKCHSIKYFHLCTKCQQHLCSEHMLFLKGTTRETFDSSKAMCACCFFGIKRSTKFVDPILPDPLARALLQETPKFRDQVFKTSIEYHAKVKRCIEKAGFFYPTMAPRPNKKIREFMELHSEKKEERERRNAAQNSFWNGTVGDTSQPHIEV